MRRLILLLALATVTLVGASTAIGGDGPPWGQDPCSHGSTGKDCRPDPQPDKGKDCEHHGKNGGVNEDHCLPTPPPPVDVCPNLEGVQTTVPAGYVLKYGKCKPVENPPPPPPTPPPPSPPPPFVCPDGGPPNEGKDGDVPSSGNTNDDCDRSVKPPVKSTPPTVTPPVVTPPAVTPPAVTPPAASPPKAKPPVKKATSKVKPPIKKKTAIVKKKPKMPPVCPVAKPFKGKCAVMGSG